MDIHTVWICKAFRPPPACYNVATDNLTSENNCKCELP